MIAFLGILELQRGIIDDGKHVAAILIASFAELRKRPSTRDQLTYDTTFHTDAILHLNPRLHILLLKIATPLALPFHTCLLIQIQKNISIYQ